ncbi:DnaD domain protein [Paenibacillus sp. P96]|uniref:DnaD domain protein n=1 Tax=Paenibacillus zeirhizosphaerae TaxID=2987519 RepID=A0ABT9FL45_9BACL|nr:DnaD domain protein [Paenibacillus sp. P96]MDP4095455.1 DnaD domain protein [Paenibacillus sp. P96]
MEYIKEVSSFYDWLETNTLTDSAIVLWHALMHTCNRAGWPDEFAVAISTLSNKTGLKKDAINRARNRLQQVGRIDFQSRSGQQSAIYRIIPFQVAAQKTTQIDSNRDSGVLSATKRVAIRAQTTSQPAPQSASIIKDFKSASASSSGTGEVEKGYESFYAAHNRVFGFDCNPFQSSQLASYIDQDGMSEAVVIRAIERAGNAAAGYNFKLITKILDDYFKSGVRELEQAVAIDREFDNRQQKPIRKQVGKVRSFAEMARGTES